MKRVFLSTSFFAFIICFTIPYNYYKQQWFFTTITKTINNKKGFIYLKNYACGVDYPFSMFWKQMLHVYPNAKVRNLFILVVFPSIGAEILVKELFFLYTRFDVWFLEMNSSARV